MTEHDERDDGGKPGMTEGEFPKCPLRPDPTTLDFIEYWEREEGVTRADVDRLLATPLGHTVLMAYAVNYINAAWKVLWLLRDELARLFPPTPDDVVLYERDGVVFYRRHLRILRHFLRFCHIKDSRRIAVPGEIYAAREDIRRLEDSERAMFSRMSQPGVIDDSSELAQNTWSKNKMDEHYLSYWFTYNRSFVDNVSQDPRFLAGIASFLYVYADLDDLAKSYASLWRYMSCAVDSVDLHLRFTVICRIASKLERNPDIITKDLLKQHPEMLVRPPADWPYNFGFLGVPYNE